VECVSILVALTEINKVMKLNKSIIVVTGGASGIGKALVRQFSSEGATVIIADLNLKSAVELAKEVGGLGVFCDVRVEQSIIDLVKVVTDKFNKIDIFCSNAGVIFEELGDATSTRNADWQSSWEVNVMAHVFAARACLPFMVSRRKGYFLQIISAAGLLSQIGNSAYSTSKHAALGFAESLSITHGDDGVRVSVVCPQYVLTPMLGHFDSQAKRELGDIMSPEDVAKIIISGVLKEEFLILPHPEVKKYFLNKATNYSKWLEGMKKLRQKVLKLSGDLDIKSIIKSL